ncbi:MAG: DNA translocase FtsK 4TM domain-containing protein [Anaerolineae bacterium]
MARRKGKKKPGSGFNLPPARQREIVGLLLITVAGVTVLSLLSANQGTVTETWLQVLRRLFGWGFVLVPLGLGAVGFWMVLDSLDEESDVGWERPLGGVLIFLVIIGLFHLFPSVLFPDDPQDLADANRGGGLIGYALSRVLLLGVGPLGSLVILFAVLAIGLIMLFSLSLAELGAVTAGVWHHARSGVRDRYDDIVIRGPNSPPPPPVEERPGLRERVIDRVRESPVAPGRHGQSEAAAPPRGLSTPAQQRRPLVPRIIGGQGPREWRLPRISDILEENIDQELSQAEIRQKVQIIEQTLREFGVPASVVEVNQGPTVTQFGVEPGYVERKTGGKVKRTKVKVSRINALADDLALALAASPIRIEAPVPGRSVVGIEVPNSDIHLVALRGVMESETFQQTKGELKIALGQDVSGQPVVTDLTRLPHLLIAGATGSGKSVCINSVLACLLLRRTPENLRLVLIDPKRVELTNFDNIPHLAAPVVVELERVVGLLRWATREMDRRYKLFAEVGARNIAAYNQQAVEAGNPKLPYQLLVIDELADLMMISPDEVERLICRLAQMARATGIHLVIATQRPSVDVVTGLIKANFPARISFAVTSQVDSRVILDAVGAERLLGRGDMLWMAPDSSKLKRLQGCFVSDRELDRLVRYWKGMGPHPERWSSLDGPGEPIQAALWEDETDAGDDDEDPLWEDALDIVRQHRSASVSLLQRKLRIGYSRAARLIDIMEERGIVGPARGNQPRPVLDLENSERDWIDF